MKGIMKICVLTLAMVCSAGVLYSQSPVSLIFKGTLNDDNGNRLNKEECMVSLSVVSQDGEIYCNKQAEIVTGDSGTFSMYIEEIPVIFAANGDKEDAAISIKVNASPGSSWIENNKLEMMYLLEKNAENEFLMYTFEGDPLNYTTMKPVWEFSDIQFNGQLSSRFIISFSDEYADIESMEVVSKMMNGSTDIKPATPPPRKRGIKGGYAVGGYNRGDNDN